MYRTFTIFTYGWKPKCRSPHQTRVSGFFDGPLGYFSAPSLGSAHLPFMEWKVRGGGARTPIDTDFWRAPFIFRHKHTKTALSVPASYRTGLASNSLCYSVAPSRSTQVLVPKRGELEMGDEREIPIRRSRQLGRPNIPAPLNTQFPVISETPSAGTCQDRCWGVAGALHFRGRRRMQWHCPVRLDPRARSVQCH